MKKKMLLMMSTVIMGVTIVGCQATSSTDALSVENETLEFTQEESLVYNATLEELEFFGKLLGLNVVIVK